jgi:uncharacterized membrane protein
MDVVAWDWLSFAVRWFHVIAGIAWIGSSFYFIALDLGLRRPEDGPEGVSGEAWQVHGGGFYHIQKYMVAPARLPAELTWFKWEAYSTWLSGFFLLVIVYYASAELFLIDRNIMDLPVWAAVAIGIGALAVGWLAYDLLCRSPLGKGDAVLSALLLVFLVAVGWILSQLFSGRGAMLHLGALIGTMMVGNVFFVIIPNQKRVVADLIAGRTPEPALGLQAKQRSLHNNYLTLPVLFLMVVVHLPLAFATQWNWAIAGIVIVMGAVIRHFFNEMHAGRGMALWTWAVAAALFVAAMFLSALPPGAPGEPDRTARGAGVEALAASPHFAAAESIVVGRCAMCHAREPAWEGLRRPPGNVVLETGDDVVRHARAIELQAVRSSAMPPGNVSFMTDDERRLLAAWLADGR